MLKPIFPEERWVVVAAETEEIQKKVGIFVSIAIEKRLKPIKVMGRKGFANISLTARKQKYIDLITDGLKLLHPDQQFSLADTYIFCEESQLFSLEERLEIIETLNPVNESCKLKRNSLKTKLEFSKALGSTYDEALNLNLSPDDIILLEQAFNKKLEITRLCSVAVINYPPTVISKLFAVCMAFNQLKNEIISVDDLYFFSIDNFLKKSDDPCRFKYIEAAVRCVVEYVAIDDHDDDSGWGIEDDSGASEFEYIENRIKGILLEKIGRIEDLDLDEISSIKGILNSVILQDIYY